MYSTSCRKVSVQSICNFQDALLMASEMKHLAHYSNLFSHHLRAMIHTSLYRVILVFRRRRKVHQGNSRGRFFVIVALRDFFIMKSPNFQNFYSTPHLHPLVTPDLYFLKIHFSSTNNHLTEQYDVRGLFSSKTFTNTRFESIIICH